MLTCIIRYHIDPTKKSQFNQYARTWGQAIPRCDGIYEIADLAEYEQYRKRLANDPQGRENYEFAQQEKFLLREDRTFLKLVSTPHGPPS